MPAPTSTTLIDRVDDTDEPIGLIRRDQVFELHAGFRVVHVLVENAAGDLLLQQVGAGRQRSALRWGSSVAGYLFAHETYRHAAERRMAEEIGLGVHITKLGSVRMADQGAIKFIELFRANAEKASIREPGHIEALRFWSLAEIDMEMDKNSGIFTETFPYVYRLYRTAADAA